MKWPGKILLLCCLAFWSSQLLAAVTASVDRSRITVDDSINLTLLASAGESLDAVNLDPLLRDFKLGGTSTTRSYNLINGRAESSTNLQITLFPRRSGSLEIPALDVNGTHTAPITILVANRKATLDGVEDVFAEAEVDVKTLYVQAQLLLTIRSYQAVNSGNPGQIESPIAR